MSEFIFDLEREEEPKKEKKQRKKKPWMLIELFNAITINKNVDDILKKYKPNKADIIQLIRHMSFDENLYIYGGLLNDWLMSSSIDASTMLKILEKMLPKKKMFIRSSKDKKDRNFLKDIEIIKNYFFINDLEAESYLNILNVYNKYDEFFDMFKEGVQ